MQETPGQMSEPEKHDANPTGRASKKSGGQEQARKEKGSQA